MTVIDISRNYSCHAFQNAPADLLIDESNVSFIFVLQQRMAQEVLTHLKEHPDAWTRVDTILEFSQNMNTKVS